MVQYKDYVFGRDDKYNITLYRYHKKEIFESPQPGKKGRGKGTGEFKTELVEVGHYQTLNGVLNKISQMEMENVELDKYIQVVKDMKTYIDSLKFPELEREKNIPEQLKINSSNEG